MGFAFRSERADGIHHVWAIDEHGGAVDPSVRLYGTTGLAGYLGVRLAPEHVQRLALGNGLSVPLAIRLQARRATL